MWRFFFPPTPKTTLKRSRNRCFRPQVEVLEDRCCPSGAGVEWSDPFNGLAVQANGQILAAGETNTPGYEGDNVKGGNTSYFVVVRYNPDLTLDTSFGN